MTTFTPVTTDNFETEVLQAELPVVLIFSVDDCDPCTAMEPVSAKLAEEYAGKLIFKNCHVQLEEIIAGTHELVKRFDVMGFPTAMLFKDSEALNSSLGHMDRALYMEFISEAL